MPINMAMQYPWTGVVRQEPERHTTAKDGNNLRKSVSKSLNAGRDENIHHDEED
jgi:hypothetical protein